MRPGASATPSDRDEDAARDILRRAIEGDAGANVERLAAELRALTAGREHTPAEVLQREARDG